ncbi:hypothetical protein BMS3Abin02_01326 [bacterium BMS3Abin02]|nr:hypothetical protein BMS3Abin02_01326 [bacterium BMS3Abin02]GBE21727.1 hypothetical protein BMS3Bbin01_01079 [bacterium BMS3Bbin01]
MDQEPAEHSMPRGATTVHVGRSVPEPPCDPESLLCRATKCETRNTGPLLPGGEVAQIMALNHVGGKIRVRLGQMRTDLVLTRGGSLPADV